LSALLALVGTLAITTPASAASDSVRVDIEVLDLAGQPVAGVDVVVTSGVDSVTATTNEWGDARARVDIAPGDTVTVAPQTETLVPAIAFEDVADGDRFDAEFTTPIAQGFDMVLSYRDLTGDGSYDTAWHRENVGAQDDWIVLGGDGSVVTARFAFHPVTKIYAAETDGLAGQEIVALERQPDGTTHVWTWSPATGAEDAIDAGALPSTDANLYDFDGDGLDDFLFIGSVATEDGVPFTIVEGDGDVDAFSLGGPTSLLDGELTDVTGDGLTDVFVNQVIPGQTIRWFVWHSEDGVVRTADMGTHGETPITEGVLDGDHDGLVEFVGAFEVPGDDRGWEVLEYATGDQFEVILGPEDDRGPSSHHYPASWFTP
jgi:hypothetical protein